MSRKQWHQLTLPLARVKLLQFRNRLRENNLINTTAIAPTDHLPKPQLNPDGHHLRVLSKQFRDPPQTSLPKTGPYLSGGQAWLCSLATYKSLRYRF
ncbi:hypothetical protein [Acaryochloris sp. IP29b_bin.148]|uniref:hypothetical protein n=1 Tax=Acaryochloris sp. IP29b_bin.148 TaxID=2969218 RepID=UPI00262B8F92|nr:hypothetical protein [Acaryochloris sp. IP29b_bin.148]